jgi:hypothetical protein
MPRRMRLYTPNNAGTNWNNGTQSGSICSGVPPGIVPSEYQKRYSRQIAKERVQQFVEKTGRLLSLWPDIVDAARTLRQRSIRLVAPLRKAAPERGQTTLSRT